MKKIFKYDIPCEYNFKLKIHKGSHILTIKEVNGKFFIYALINEKEPLEEKQFYVVPTGEQIVFSLMHYCYVDTFVIKGSPIDIDLDLVFHLFEEVNLIRNC